MATKQIEARTCDRCGHYQEFRHECDIYLWSHASYFQENGPLWRGNEDKTAKSSSQPDLCPNCTTGLANWWRDGRKDDQP